MEVRVVAGLIFNNKKQILIAQRPKRDKNAYQWEFPGGKVRKKENLRKALLREIREELGMEIEIIDKLRDFKHYGIKLTLFLCKSKYSRPKLLFHSQAKWVKIERLKFYQFLEIDKKIINWLNENFRYYSTI